MRQLNGDRGAQEDEHMAMKLEKEKKRQPWQGTRRLRRAAMTDHQARSLADQMLAENRVTGGHRLILEAVSTSGLLTTAQIEALTGYRPRTLDRMATSDMLQRLSPRLYGEQVAELYGADDPYDRALWVYTLGKVGRELCKKLFEDAVTDEGQYIYQVAHDLGVAETVRGLKGYFTGLDLDILWSSRKEVSLADRQGKAALEPDGALEVLRDGVSATFLIEFQNEANRRRIVNKVARYQKVYSDDYWPVEYGEVFPFVLVVFRKQAVADGMLAAVRDAKKRNLKVQFLAKHFEELRDGVNPGRWVYVNEERQVDLVDLLPAEDS